MVSYKNVHARCDTVRSKKGKIKKKVSRRNRQEGCKCSDGGYKARSCIVRRTAREVERCARFGKNQSQSGQNKSEPFIDGLHVQGTRSSPFKNTVQGNENVRYILMNFEGSHITNDVIIH